MRRAAGRRTRESGRAHAARLTADTRISDTLTRPGAIGRARSCICGRQQRARRCCLPWRLSHKSPSDPVCRTVMGRSMFNRPHVATKWDETVASARIARRLPPLRFLSFSDPFTRQPRLDAIVCEHARQTPAPDDEQALVATRHALATGRKGEALPCPLPRGSLPRFVRAVAHAPCGAPIHHRGYTCATKARAVAI
jgi:hypothetical protein